MNINIPAEIYVEMLKEMDKAKDGWEAADIMHTTLQAFMEPGSINAITEAYYDPKEYGDDENI